MITLILTLGNLAMMFGIAVVYTVVILLGGRIQ